jgi:hypothetical protein
MLARVALGQQETFSKGIFRKAYRLLKSLKLKIACTSFNILIRPLIIVLGALELKGLFSFSFVDLRSGLNEARRGLCGRTIHRGLPSCSIHLLKTMIERHFEYYFNFLKSMNSSPSSFAATNLAIEQELPNNFPTPRSLLLKHNCATIQHILWSPAKQILGVGILSKPVKCQLLPHLTI